MARDQYEFTDGRGRLQDRYGREQLVLVNKHQAPASTDLLRGYERTDADGRPQAVLISGTTGRNLLDVEADVVTLNARKIQVDYQLYGPEPGGLAIASGIAAYAHPTGAASASTKTLLAGINGYVELAYWTLIFTPNAVDNLVELYSATSLSGSTPQNYAQLAESTPSSSATPIPQFANVTTGIRAIADEAAAGALTASAFNRIFGYRVKTGATGMSIAESRLSIVWGL